MDGVVSGRSYSLDTLLGKGFILQVGIKAEEGVLFVKDNKEVEAYLVHEGKQFYEVLGVYVNRPEEVKKRILWRSSYREGDLNEEEG